MTENVKGLEELTPKQIVQQLDHYIIGQEKAKKAVAIALRNRTRRLKLPEEIRDEIAPKNILMIGPTGVGKTEIARRLAKLCGAPFLKVEATKYTEVGYVGRDVESMVRDLMSVGYKMVKSEMQEQLKAEAEKKVEEKLLDLLLPGSNPKDKKGEKKPDVSSSSSESVVPSDKPISGNGFFMVSPSAGGEKIADNSTREKFRTMLREGKLEEREVEVTVSRRGGTPTMEIFAGGSIEDLESTMQNIASMMNGSGSKRRMVTVAEARKILTEDVLDSMVDMDKVADIAKHRVEQMGIIFIDEIDKIANSSSSSGGGQDVSREGVQRDILPIIEGSSVNTKFGVVDTTHILFIASGAFSVSKPSDLIAELQGRFPLRVELTSLNADDFELILKEPKNSLIKQYVSLMETEDVKLEFTEDAIKRMSFIAYDVNSRIENIGARRLHTIMETLLEDISFEADEHKGETIKIDASYVDQKLTGIFQNQDISRYIL
ncbi:MAG: ATP-dependent protease ATPase subunit HslU [Treponemataceae bacterium]|nr:ATP-dependent protease ATPase subunit HslU [Spirochaetales bacterium]MDY6030338.1 ATP-dependent protease ATPase subunit HslU [Treponemataceae bacterium]